MLGNHEDRIWSKSDRFAPVLRGDSLHFLVSLAVEKGRPLCQGDCKNAFCQGILPPDKITIVHPLAGDPETNPNEYWLLQKTLYGLCCSPRHWYDKINRILKSIGLRPSLEDPCLFTGFSKTLMILRVHHHLIHFLLGYMLTTLCTSQRILQ